MRRCELIGNLGKDGELKAVGDSSVLNFSVAAKGTKKDDEGQWFRCALWGKRAESLAEYLKKGQKVFVRGEFRLRSWNSGDKSGTDIEVSVDEIELVGGKKEEAGLGPI